MGTKDLPMAIALLIIFIVLYVISFTFQSSGVLSSHTTASFFPRVVLAMAIFLTLILIVQSIWGKSGKTASKKIDGTASRRITLSMVSAIAFGFGVSYLGTLVSISLFIAAIMLSWGIRKKYTIFFNALLTPIAIYLIFTKILLVQLPKGILF